MNKQCVSLLLCLMAIGSTFAKENLEEKANQIEAEGKTLYKTDMASWFGTDVLQANFKGDLKNIDGYFSYLDDDKRVCIFYSKDNFHKIIFEVTFDSTYNIKNAVTSSAVRPFNAKEQELFNMREKAKALAYSDTLFKHYNNTTLNLIPIIYNNERRVYIITGTNENHMVPLGNDYLITFDKDLNVKKTIKIHANFIPIENKNSDTAFASFHSHLKTTGDFITPTDVCTIMEYEKLEKWKSHIVVSEKYFSIWDCSTDRLLILTKDVWEKINKDQKKRHPEE